ncbi:UDP-2,3-diacylglucosamine diphosphatase [Tahibacter amnicola]|uniref:UDP-2,3-diacylglucosamine diphosphatase n=1 Tax=Tahibacter amnicola TaxID=2976241 RepID=A0ABY6BH03_9GAMM|nr:UDP-2,3-diacylglucosamine diphosphatase [Tahibacter amnicola]UXI69149.1 UDP-2,3-diacylglucosamine diphosphatase [Tahibacter amnicola]
MDRLRFRTIFISDIHLGTRDCRAEFLLDFLRSTRCNHLYLVGDIIDLEALEHTPYWPALHSQVMAEFLDLAATGTQVTYIPGNHDARLRGLAGQRIGAIDIALDAIHVGADSRRYCVCHGDEFDPEHQGRSWLKWFGDRGYRFLCALNRGLNALRRRLRLPYFALSILAKSSIGKAVDFIRRYESCAIDSARSRGLDGQICGHIHFGTIRREGGVDYMNDGDWVEHCTALVEHFDGRFELLHWTDRRAALAQLPTSDTLRSPVPLPAWARRLLPSW